MKRGNNTSKSSTNQVITNKKQAREIEGIH